MAEQTDLETKRLSRGTPMGVVAAARHPNPDDRKTVAEGIRAQDADLQVGNLEPIVFKTAEVGGIKIKLEPVSPSLGTVIHGLDVDSDLDNEEVVTFCLLYTSPSPRDS